MREALFLRAAADRTEPEHRIADTSVVPRVGHPYDQVRDDHGLGEALSYGVLQYLESGPVEVRRPGRVFSETGDPYRDIAVIDNISNARQGALACLPGEEPQVYRGPRLLRQDVVLGAAVDHCHGGRRAQHRAE